ncbi:MAG: hypothetical protein RL194_1241 [Pseudomonadota bacterium]|jgi:hypothetical protein
MRPSAAEQGKRAAILAESLYLANLTVLPVIGFFLLVCLHLSGVAQASALARCHLRQAISGSLWAGVLLVVLNAVILILGGYRSPATIVTLILYFFSVHTALILIGMAGLAKATASQRFVYPLIGRRCDD